MNFQEFTAKYPEFENQEDRFNAFKSDVDGEISLYKWGVLESAAWAALMAHKIALSPPTNITQESQSVSYPTGTLQEFETKDDGYRVKFQSVSSESSSYSLTSYGKEYQRLLKIATNVAPEPPSTAKGTSFIGQRGKNIIKW
jgi:hypothetical protein